MSDSKPQFKNYPIFKEITTMSMLSENKPSQPDIFIWAISSGMVFIHLRMNWVSFLPACLTV